MVFLVEKNNLTSFATVIKLVNYKLITIAWNDEVNETQNESAVVCASTTVMSTYETDVANLTVLPLKSVSL